MQLLFVAYMLTWKCCRYVKNGQNKSNLKTA